MKLFRELTKKVYSNKTQVNRMLSFTFSEKQQAKEAKPPKQKSQDNTSNQVPPKKIQEASTKKEDQKEIAYKPKSDDDLKYEYEDKKFYLNYQWSKIQADKIRMHQGFLTPELTNHQKHESEVLINIMKQFNFCEFLVFQNELKRLSRMDVGSRAEWTIPTENEMDPNFIATQNILYMLKPFIAAGYFSGGKAAEVVKEKVEEVKVEKAEEKVVVKEKAVVNIILVGFDPAKKLNLIKEFRTMYSLGLKESKEAVEKNPNIIQPNVKREEALKIKAKLEELGAKIELD